VVATYEDQGIIWVIKEAPVGPFKPFRYLIVSRHCVDDVRSKPRSVAEWRFDGTPLRFVPDYEPSTRCRETTRCLDEFLCFISRSMYGISD